VRSNQRKIFFCPMYSSKWNDFAMLSLLLE